MAQVLPEYDFSTAGSRSKYPWAEWFDGKARRLVKGTDFAVTPESLKNTAGAAAKRLNKELACVIESDTAVVMKATPAPVQADA